MSLPTASTGSPQVAPPSVDVETDIPETGIGPEKTMKIDECWKRVVLEQVTTGSPPSWLKTSGPGLRKPRSVKERPRFVERATPLKLRPPDVVWVSRKLPESLKPTTTLLPHHAVEDSLCVKPATIERVK